MTDDAITVAEKRREKTRAAIRAMHREKLKQIACEAGAQAHDNWWPELAPLTVKERAAVKAALTEGAA